MTIDEAKNVLKMTTDALTGFDLVNTHLYENLQGQIANDKLRTDGYDADKVKLVADHKAELDTLKSTHAEVLAAKDAELTAVAAGRDAAVLDREATAKDLADANAKMSNMEGHPDVIKARKEAAIKAADDKIKAAEAAKVAAEKEKSDLED